MFAFHSSQNIEKIIPNESTSIQQGVVVSDATSESKFKSPEQKEKKHSIISPSLAAIQSLNLSAGAFLGVTKNEIV